MRSFPPKRLAFALQVLVLVLACHTIGHSQDEDVKGRKGKDVPSNPTPRAPSRRAGKVRVIEYRDRVKTVSPNTGVLTIVAIPNANYTLTYVADDDIVKEGTIPADKHSIALGNLDPGVYQVSASLDGYSRVEKKVTVVKGKTETVDVIPIPRTYNLTLELNVASGQVMYWKDNETQRMVRFQSKLPVLPSLNAGKYTIEIQPDDKTYEPKRTSVNVSGGDNKVKVDLDYLLSTKEFSPTSASAWILPTAWRFDSGAFTANGRGLTLPSNSLYRNYRDFQLTADVKMLNGVAVSFIVRALDAQNYYLVQLTGPNADEHYVLRGFIYKNGQAQPFPTSLPIRQVAKTLKPGRDFNVRLTVKGNSIMVQVIDGETAATSLLGYLEDPNSTFGKGAVGVAVRDNEQFVVGSFYVCVTGCLG